MPDATFKKVGESDERMYGPYKLLVCGYNPKEQQILLNLLNQRGFSELPVIFITLEQAGKKLKEIVQLPHKSGFDAESDLEKTIIMSGFTESELHQLMNAYRTTGLPRPLWATLTPYSEKWTLNRLLKELTAERAQFQKQ